METPSVPCIAAFGVESTRFKINQSSHTLSPTWMNNAQTNTVCSVLDILQELGRVWPSYIFSCSGEISNSGWIHWLMQLSWLL